MCDKKNKVLFTDSESDLLTKTFDVSREKDDGKGKPKLGLWYLRVSLFNLEAYSDSDYAGSNIERKSTKGGCQFLGRDLFLANANAIPLCYFYYKGRILLLVQYLRPRPPLVKDKESHLCLFRANPNAAFGILGVSYLDLEASQKIVFSGEKILTGNPQQEIQNQMLDYGFNFMNTKIYIDNESTICIVKNPVYHSKTKHIAIRHHFIRDAYEKKLIQVLKIHTDDNVADLLTKAFDVSRFQFLVCAEAFLNISDEFQEVNWVFKSHWEEIQTLPYRQYGRLFEKTEGNAEFHEVIDFLARSSIHRALIVHYVNVADKLVSISEASIRSDLLFDDADGIDSLPNQAIFDVIKLMGHLDVKKKFVMYPRFISIFLDKQLMNVPVPLDHFLVNALTNKVFSFMVKKGKHFSGKVTPLFVSMLVQPTEDAGTPSERPSEPQPTPFPPHPSEATVEPQSDPSPRPSPSTHIPDSIPKSSGGNQGEAQEASQMSQERKEKEVSTEDALGTDKQKDSTDKEKVSTDRSDEGTNRQKVSTDKEKVSTDRPDEGTVDQTKGRSATPTTPTPTPTIFEDDETITQVLLNMSQAKAVSREKEKGVELKDVEETERPRPISTISLLTLKPLPKIDPKDKGKNKIKEEDESDTESEGIPEAEKKFKQLARDEEMARKVQEDWEAEEEVKKLAEEEAIKAVRNYCKQT
ncbi:hypothetical protein Tco_1342159 [Tanacetum coccineum]